MRILHTADWHVGEVLKGRGRQEEHAAVLADILRIAGEEEVDLVLLAGDVFDTPAPNTDAQSLVMRTLMDLARDGRQVVVQAGNHDNPRQWDVFRPLLGELGLTVVGTPKRAAEGGQVELTIRTGEKARIAVLPFVAQRYAVRAAEAMTRTAAENNRSYAALYQQMVGALTDGFDAPGAVNLIVSHATVAGGAMGGGERQAQSVFDYYVEPAAFPVTCHYVALGHLHRRQEMPGACPVHYSGSPLQIDFGEGQNTSVAVVVDVTSDTPAATRDVPVIGGRPLVTVEGTLEQLAALTVDERAWLRVFVREKPRAGLADDVRAILPGAIAVNTHEDFLAVRGNTASRPSRVGKSSGELFTDYLTEVGRGDADTLRTLFDRLLDGVQTSAHDQATTGPTEAGPR